MQVLDDLFATTDTKGGGGGVFDSRALPSFANTFCAFGEDVVLDHFVTVRKSVTVLSAYTVVVTIAALALGALICVCATAAVVHAGFASAVRRLVESVHALLADTLSAADVAVIATVDADGTAGAILKDLVVVSASLATVDVTSAVNAVVNAAGASSVVGDGVAVSAFLTRSVKGAHCAVGNFAQRAEVFVVHVVAVRAFFAGVRVGVRGGSLTATATFGQQADSTAVQVAVKAVAIFVGVVTIRALQAFACVRLVFQTVGTMVAASNVAVTALSSATAVLEVVAAISRFIITVGVVAAAFAVAFVVTQKAQRAQIQIPALGKFDAIAVNLCLVVTLCAFRAVALAEAVFAVVDFGARRFVIVEAEVGAQSAVGIAASELGARLAFKARASTVACRINVGTAIAVVSEALALGDAASLRIKKVSIGTRAA